MAALSIAALRQAVAARIAGGTWNTGAWGAGGFWEAPVPFESFGISGVPDAVPGSKAHGAFVVGTPATTDPQWRQKPGEGVWATTDLRVRFFARHTPGPSKSQASQDAATNIEQAIVARLMAVDATWPATFQITLSGIPSRALTTSGEWFLTELSFNARHIYALQ